jgi:hypothetical protein
VPVWSGVAVPYTRLLGQVDQDDPTNLPVGCAAVCLNTDFTRDSPGVTAAGVRAGNCMTAKGAASPGTGLWDFQYEPVSASDAYFQMLTVFRLNGMSEYEKPAGSGRLIATPAGMFVPPANSHRIDTQAGNILWSGYSNLINPTAGCSGFNPKTLTIDPLGMKPFGFRWQPGLYVYAGEVVTPSNQSAGPQGNGHTYQAQNSGWTAVAAGNEPVWPLTEGGTVLEAPVAAGQLGVTWKELTMVMANRIAVPEAPAAVVTAGGGTWPGGQDVYLIYTFVNGMGETTAGPSQKLTAVPAASTIAATVPTLASLPGWEQGLAAPYAITGVNVYVAAVTTGAQAPPQSQYELYNLSPAALGTIVNVLSASVSGIEPPSINSARITPGQLPAPTSEAVLTRDSGAGAFPAGRDIWVRLSFSNTNGETPLGPSNSIINTLANDAVQVTLSQPAEFPQLKIINIYEADVATGAAEPPISAYARVGAYAPTATATITTTATGAPPVTVNGTGPGGNITADTEDGGINETQGYRYAVPCWINRNETFSGFSQAAVSKYIVDEDGWEISVFNVATGPANIVGRAINWTTADSTQGGGFWWIGLVNLQVPSQNIVYPNSYLSDGITIIPTVFLDNVTTKGTFNFTDQYLESSNNTTDRLRVNSNPAFTQPSAVRVNYLKSCDRLSLALVPGYESGLVISLGADYESYYGDTSPVPIPTNSGEKCWGAVEFRNVIYAMRERSGVVITPGTGDPASWDVKERWGASEDSEGVGPCGSRAFASNGQFIIFVHRSGIYRYEGTADPDLMTKEIPRMWGAINWAAAQTIAVCIDGDTHTVRIQVPVNGSMIPNLEICLSYLEGWLNPIHFSSYAAKEITQEAGRRYSFNDFSAYVVKRIQRKIANPQPLPLGPDGTTQLTSDFNISQLAYTTTDPSGIINARTPGRYDDNETGIDWKYQGISASAMQKPCKAEGVTVSARGYGPVNVAFVAGRQSVTSNVGPKKIVRMRPMDLVPDQPGDITRKAPRTSTSEYWSILFDNGKQPGVWASVKKYIGYVIPVKAARGALDRGGR